MNNGSQILKYNSVELQSAGRLFFKEGQHSFLEYINNMHAVTDAAHSMACGRWELLSSILGSLSSHYDINFSVYENPFGLLFDIGFQSVESKDFPALHDGIGPESEAGELQLLKNERDQIENEIALLQERHIEICRRIKGLNSLEPAHSLSVLIAGE